MFRSPARRLAPLQAQARAGQQFTDQAADWMRKLRLAERACCCPAKPAMVAVLAARPGSSEQVDLFLCRHHGRVSQASLAAAGATVYKLP